MKTVQVDFGIMAHTLGIRENRLRLALKFPTPLQKRVRESADFFAITTLGRKFEKSDRDTCGPKFEEEEKVEYLARRATLFPNYLARFNTIEEFKNFGKEEGLGHISGVEREAAGVKLASLVRLELEAAGDDLAAVLKVRYLVTFFDEKVGLRNAELNKELKEKLQNAFVNALRNARTTATRMDILNGMPITCHELFGDTANRRGSEVASRWTFVWEEAKTLDEALKLESMGDKNGYLNDHALKQRPLVLLEEAMEKFSSFMERVMFANTFADRDKGYPDELYSRALELTAQKAEDEQAVRLVVARWNERKGKIRDSNQLPATPAVMSEKWDQVFRSRAETETNTVILASLMNDSPYNTGTRFLAEKRLRAYFDNQVEAAGNDEELDAIEKEVKRLSVHVNVWERRNELRDANEALAMGRLFARVKSKIDPTPKTTLIELYRYYTEKKNGEKVEEILRLLLPYFPAESVETVEIP